MMDHFRDKVAIVTGAASGMGLSLCEHLGRWGAMVIAADINEQGSENVASAISQSGGRANAVHLDVSKEQDVQNLVEETVTKHGRLDFMFNNAGIAVAGEARDVGPEHWRRVIDVDLLGVIYGITAAYPVMVKQGQGHIVNTASLAGLIPAPFECSYAAAKHGVVGLSSSLRAEGAELGVKVSVVCPGFVRTAIFDATPVMNANMDDVLATVPFKMIDAASAGRIILRGVKRNLPFIVFPFHARFLWWLHRLHPVLSGFVGRKMVKDIRKVRKES